MGAALAVLFPVWCAACDQPGAALCPACADALVPKTLDSPGPGVPTGHDAAAWPLSQTLACGLRVHSALAYDGAVARVIRALKQDGRTSLARPLGVALRTVLAPHLDENTAVVPVPSSRAAFRRRGYSVTELLVRRAGAHPVRALRAARASRDQRALGRAERAGNVVGTFRARPRDGARVVLVDDVVTTGATLAEAAHTLRDAGAEVVCAVTVAATPRRGGRRFLTASAT